MPTGAAGLLVRLLLFAYHLLYYPLAFAYDLVAWLVSAGEWADWRRTVIPFLPPGPVLEIAHGTGTLALDLASRGFRVTAFDLSPHMVRIASRKIRRWRPRSDGAPPVLFRGDVRALPLRRESFSSAVSTFPAEFVVDLRTAREVHRLLIPRGLWMIVPTAYPSWIPNRTRPVGRNADAFLRELEQIGFEVRMETIRCKRSFVVVVLARRSE